MWVLLDHIVEIGYSLLFPGWMVSAASPLRERVNA